MNKQQILDAIAASAELQGFAAAGNTQAIADALTATAPKVVVSKMVSARGLSEKLAGGPLAAEAVLVKLETARDAMLASPDQNVRLVGSLLRRQLAFLSSDGLDFGSPALRGMLDQFAADGIITTTEAANLKAIAEENVVITHTQVGEALRS